MKNLRKDDYRDKLYDLKFIAGESGSEYPEVDRPDYYYKLENQYLPEVAAVCHSESVDSEKEDDKGLKQGKNK